MAPNQMGALVVSASDHHERTARRLTEVNHFAGRDFPPLAVTLDGLVLSKPT